MKYLECEIIKVSGNVTYFASVDDTVDVMFMITNAIVEPEARINPNKSMPVIFKGDLDDTIPFVRLKGGKSPIRVQRPETMSYCGMLQITFKLDDIRDCYVETNRELK